MADQLENKEPAIGQIKVQTGDDDDSIVKGMLLAQSIPISAVLIALLIGGVIGFGSGAYVQTQRLKPDVEALASARAENAKLVEKNNTFVAGNQETINRLNAELGVNKSEINDAKNANWNLSNLLDKALNRPPKEVPVYVSNKDPGLCVQGEERVRLVNAAGYKLEASVNE